MSPLLASYQSFVQDFIDLHRRAAKLDLGRSSPLPQASGKGGKALIFAPHPDDEAVIGVLALRLLRELDVQVINVAVTLGSKTQRKAGRLQELRTACDTLGFELIVPGDLALDGVNLQTRQTNPSLWQANVAAIAAIISRTAPDLVFFPHDDDFNSTHIGTHHLVADALRLSAHPTLCLETEFWHMMRDPNLLIGLGTEDEARLVLAIAAHTGEVERNPYHVNHPGRMADNVMRGSEVVGGQGGHSVSMDFAMPYRCRLWTGQDFAPAFHGGRIYGPQASLADLLKLAP